MFSAVARLNRFVFHSDSKKSAIASDRKRAFEELEALANTGWTRAQVLLGICAEHGIIGNKNTAKAFQWFKTAADRGDVLGQLRLAECYEFGIGVEKHDENKQLVKSCTTRLW